MKRTILSLLVLALLVVMTAARTYAQAAPAAAPATAANAREEATRSFEDAAGKLLRLAEAIPAEKYTWRPADGVRSVSEVFLHSAAGNFAIPRRLGTPPPEGFDGRGYDRSTTDKAKVIEALKQSIEHAKKAFAAVDDVEKTAPFGGRQASYREIMFFISMHNHEHLGQMIAYARMNGITPPWTEEQQQQQPPAKRP